MIEQDQSIKIAGVEVTKPHKVYYPKGGITKLDIAEYYQRVFPDLIRFLVNRPISMVRSPGGVDRHHFYQKHPTENFPEYIERVMIDQKEGVGKYIVIDELADIVYLTNIGVVEYHIWGARADDLEHPERIVFDLDPAADARWEYVIKGALLLKDRLQKDGLTSFPMTTGGKGVHVVVPIAGERSWDQIKAYSKSIASEIVEQHPEAFTVELSKQKRTKKVFIDYLRNSRGSTAIAPFSTRGWDSAPIAKPVNWQDVTTKLRPDMFGILNISEWCDDKVWQTYDDHLNQLLPLD